MININPSVKTARIVAVSISEVEAGMEGGREVALLWSLGCSLASVTMQTAKTGVTSM